MRLVRCYLSYLLAQCNCKLAGNDIGQLSHPGHAICQGSAEPDSVTVLKAAEATQSDILLIIIKLQLTSILLQFD